ARVCALRAGVPGLWRGLGADVGAVCARAPFYSGLSRRANAMRSWFVAALGRARRRKSPWNLLLLLALPLWALIWWGGFRLVWAYHLQLYPAHAGALSQFWPAGISPRAFVPSFLMVFGPM